MDTLISWLGVAALAAIVAVLIGVLTALPVWLLWNAVVPAVFGLTQISFTQALCLSLLCSFLFKGSASSSSSKS